MSALPSKFTGAEDTNGYFTLKGLPAGFHELCIHTMGTFMNAITVNVNMFITIMDDAEAPSSGDETLPPSTGNRTDNENDEAAMAEEDLADELVKFKDEYVVNAFPALDMNGIYYTAKNI